MGPQVAEKLGIPQITYSEAIEAIDKDKIRIKRRLDNGVEVVESPYPVLITVNGTSEPCRPRNAKALQKYKHAKTITERQSEASDYIDLYSSRPFLNLIEWSVEDVEADKEQCGLSGSPTKVKKIQNIVFQVKESKVLSDTDADMEELIKELIANHTIG